MRCNMKTNCKTLIKCLAIPLIAGGVSALLTRKGRAVFPGLLQPPLSPPGWLFPVAWTILYLLMGLASYLIYTSKAKTQDISQALTLYGYQLLVNFLWPVFFFSFQWYLFAFFWLLLLWVLIINTMLQFYRISSAAAWLLLPYLAWVTFAGYLNLAIWYVNR